MTAVYATWPPASTAATLRLGQRDHHATRTLRGPAAPPGKPVLSEQRSCNARPVVIAGREGKAATMPVRRDPRTGAWFFLTTVRTPDGEKVRLLERPVLPVHTRTSRGPTAGRKRPSRARSEMRLRR